MEVVLSESISLVIQLTQCCSRDANAACDSAHTIQLMCALKGVY